MIKAWTKARTLAESAFPSTSAARGVGLARNLWTIPRSRSQMIGNAVENGDEQDTLRQNAGCHEVDVWHVAGWNGACCG